jgi:adenylate cyclase
MSSTERTRATDIEKIFGRFMEPEVLELLLANKNIDQILRGEKRRVTCMFCDICGFTPLAERIGSPELFVLLNQYFGHVIDIIFAHEGTIDKMIGDAIMVLFGAPIDQENQEARAVRCAIDIQRKLAAIRSAVETGVPLNMSVTINTGEVSAGCLGNERRMDYTVLGDVINIAARMQDLTKPDQILMGEETKRSLPDGFECRSIGTAELKGRSNLQEFYEVIFS